MKVMQVAESVKSKIYRITVMPILLCPNWTADGRIFIVRVHRRLKVGVLTVAARIILIVRTPTVPRGQIADRTAMISPRRRSTVFAAVGVGWW